jgi:AcrR family transcriptional regulator
MASQEALGTSPDSTEERSVPRRKLSPGPGLAPQQVASHQLARIHKATIEIAAKDGYRALKVRDIVSEAEVSTRAFYEHFGSKEDCFLRTYDLISRRATRRIIAAQMGEPDWRKRSQLVLEEFVRELEAGPDGARLALVEASLAGEASLEQVWRAERAFESMLAECFSRDPGGVVVPPMIVEGIVAGIASVSRDRLLAGKVADLSGLSGELVDWALCYPDRVATELARLDRQSVWRDTTLEPLPVASSSAEEPWSSTGDRALILAAIAELAAAHGYAGLTAPRIRAAASVSRRKFEAHFDGVEDCYLAALEQRVARAMAQAARAQTAADSWAGGVYRAIAALCEYIVADAFLVRVCLTNDFPPGPDGHRSRRRLLAAVKELLSESTPEAAHSPPSGFAASTGAIWSLFHHHIIRNRTQHRQIAATLSYLALAPAISAPTAVAAIQGQQSA